MASGFEPVPTPETAPFWEGTLLGQLRLQHCAECSAYHFYPREVCPQCGSREIEWHTVSGTGRLVSYIINYRPLPPTNDNVPQIIALVELDEGPRMLTNIVDTPPEPDLLKLDSRVEVRFEPRGKQALPMFAVINGAAS